jgi:hypothetical protein
MTTIATKDLLSVDERVAKGADTTQRRLENQDMDSGTHFRRPSTRCRRGVEVLSTLFPTPLNPTPLTSKCPSTVKYNTFGGLDHRGRVERRT